VTLRRATKTKKTTISATARQPFSATSRGVIYESVNKKKKRQTTTTATRRMIESLGNERIKKENCTSIVGDVYHISRKMHHFGDEQ
jgi:hypothetical protein